MQEHISNTEDTVVITPEKIDELKQKYSQELKDSPENPIKICMKLIFEGATERDQVKRSLISYQLSEFLTKPHGIINLFLALIDFDTSSQRVTTHNQRFVAVANIITCLPSLCMSYLDYSQNIYKQLRPLLLNQEPKYSNLASIIVKALIDSVHAKEHGDKIKDLVVKPLLEAFSQPTSEYQLDQAIVVVHNLVSNHLSIDLFIEVFPHLIVASQILNDTPSTLKPLLKFTLISILNGLQPGAACCLIEKALFYSDIKSNIYMIQANDSGVSIKISENPIDSEDEDETEPISPETILSLLQASDNELLVLEFYFHFQNAIWTAKDSHHRLLSTSFIAPFLEDSSQESSASKLDIFQIIAMNRQKSIELVARTLLNHKAYLSSGADDVATKLNLVEQSMASCISILEVLCATICDKDDEVVFMTKCYPVLKELSALLANSHTTKCKSLLESIESFIEKLVDRQSEELDSKISHGQEREFAAIIKDLNDKLVPVRVHALVRLKQMVLSNDPFILPKIPQLYSMIECSLADNESYVFLSCINLLAEMAVRDTPFTLPKLIELYARTDINIQSRINVGEVLARLVKQLNETTPFYAQQVMNLLLAQCKDQEELIRMSSLTNIGEICKSLGSSMGKYIVDILVCVRSILDTDTVQVKCAAVDLLRTALSGADLLAVEAIQRELKEIYSTLKRVRGVTLDNKLCLQIDLALDEMDRIAREMLAGPSGTSTQRGTDKITKNIKVLTLL